MNRRGCTATFIPLTKKRLSDVFMYAIIKCVFKTFATGIPNKRNRTKFGKQAHNAYRQFDIIYVNTNFCYVFRINYFLLVHFSIGKR